MSSRSGPPNPNRHRLRESQQRSDSDFPPLPTPRLPSLRYWASWRERETAPPASLTRPQTRHWSTAARRADRIRSIHDRNYTPSFDELTHTIDQAWSSASRLSERTQRHQPYSPNTTQPPPSSELRDLDQTLHDANSHLRQLLDYTSASSLTPPLMPPALSSPQRPHDYPEDTRRGKRRKIDAERYSTGYRGVRYGKFGQVEPGQLRMEIVSCDGGMISPQSAYSAENLLKNDNSVYCTKGNRCNIILRHQGGSTFTLQELVIKAPGAMNYTHPVREGMVFITMKQDEALSRTADYQVQYVPHPRESTWLASGEYDLHADRESRQPVSIRHNEDGTTTATRSRRSLVYHYGDDDDSHTPEMPREFRSHQPDFQVTTQCSDDEDDMEYTALNSFRRTRNLIGSLPFEDHGSESDELRTFNADDFSDDLDRRHDNSFVAEDWAGSPTAAEENQRTGEGGLLVPYANFNIEKKKSKCTIRFDPPVSGRFMLLKMWSSRHDAGSNIDIQSVIAKGFAGPRFFPSIQLR